MKTANDNQDITSEVPKLLLCSSIASVSDQGSNVVTTPLAEMGKECPEVNWYYLYLTNKEMKRYIGVFSGRKAVKFRTSSGVIEERYFCFKVFSYTEADHKKRFEQCDYTKEEYIARRDSVRAVKEAFATDSARKLNDLTDEKEVAGNGWLFVCASLDQLELILSAMLPRQYLVTDYNTHRAAVIPQRQMEEFIYLYESMPYNIELMNRPLEDYLQKKQRIRITAGVFQGKEGCVMRLHRNTRLVFAFGNMTVAVSYLHAFPFEKVD
ncbi:transcriptional regulator [Phocaeicola sp.]